MSHLFDEFWSNSDLVAFAGDPHRTTGNGQIAFVQRFHIDAGGAATEPPKIMAAVLTFMVRGLADNAQQPVIKVNDREVAVIPSYTDGSGRHWFPQAISIAAGVLAQGDNRIEIDIAAPADHAADASHDAFQIRDLVCHYQVAAGD